MRRVIHANRPTTYYRKATSVNHMIKDIDTEYSLPAIKRSVKLIEYAISRKFDWDSIWPIFDKIREELSEVEEAARNGEKGKIKEEIGDLLFTVIILASKLGVDSEEALSFANDKFIKRFSYMEHAATAVDRTVENMEIDELNALWDEAKKNTYRLDVERNDKRQ